MVREFKFFRGYVDKTLTEQWQDIFREYPTTPGTGIINWGTTTTNPTWIVNPDWYSQQPYTLSTTPGNSGTITFPNNYNGFTTGTLTTSTLTTSNPNGITYTTTTGTVNTLTTGTATYSSNSFKN